MSPDQIASPTLRAALADQSNWRETALKPELAQIGGEVGAHLRAKHSKEFREPSRKQIKSSENCPQAIK